MINEQMLAKMIEQQVAAKLSGDKSLAATTPSELPLEPTPAPTKPVTYNLDEEDGLRLENMILKDEIEKLRKEVEEARRIAADKVSHSNKLDLQSFLIEKYKIDTKNSQLLISPESRTLTVTPRE